MFSASRPTNPRCPGAMEVGLTLTMADETASGLQRHLVQFARVPVGARVRLWISAEVSILMLSGFPVLEPLFHAQFLSQG